MVQIDFALKEVNCKVVYYGPGMSGKTTNLEIMHQKAPEQNRGELTSISTDGDRTLFFDYMPLDLGTIAGMRTKFQLYTVPGQVYYNSTRKLVLQRRGRRGVRRRLRSQQNEGEPGVAREPRGEPARSTARTSGPFRTSSSGTSATSPGRSRRPSSLRK